MIADRGGLPFPVRQLGGPPALVGPPRRLRATICGSFQRAFEEVKKGRQRLDQLGVDVLSPPSTSFISKAKGFVTLSGDPSISPRITEDRHLDAISRSDFVWLRAPDGRIGPSATLELGFATAHKVPVFTADEIVDVTLKEYVTPRPDLDRAVEHARSRFIIPPTLLLDPGAAIQAIRQELDGLEQRLTWFERPMNEGESAHVRAAVDRIKGILGNLGR